MLFYDRLFAKLNVLNFVGNVSLIYDRTVKQSEEGHF